MRKIDFISASPNLLIFQNDANQTVFGGILFLVYIIVFIILSIIFLYDYASSDDYEFDYTFVKQNQIVNYNEWKTEINKDIFYSGFEINVTLFKDLYGNGINLSDDFLVIDTNLLNQKDSNTEGHKIIKVNDDFVIKRGESHIMKGSLAVIYRCDKTDCSIREEDKIKIDSYYLKFCYKGYNIDHQSETQKDPIQKLENGHFCEKIQFLENTNIYFLNWKLIEYEEKKGIFGELFDKIAGKNNTYYGRQLSSTTIYTDDGHMRNLITNNPDWNLIDENGNHFILLLYMEHKFDPDYDRYTRKAKSIFDSLADVFALSSTVKDILTLVYAFLFAQNYDNYKIIENILMEKLKVNINDKIKEKEIETKIELKTDLIQNSSEDDKIENIKNMEEEEEKEIKISSKVDLTSPNFFDFLFNKFYFNSCCGNSSKQNLINSCNEVVAKYTSIEKIIYNQMKLENLWKDYKWNNPDYEIKEKDDLLLDLKEK